MSLSTLKPWLLVGIVASGCTTLPPLPTSKLFPGGAEAPEEPTNTGPKDPSGGDVTPDDTDTPGDADTPDDTDPPDDTGDPGDADGIDVSILSSVSELEASIRLLLVDNTPNGRDLIELYLDQTAQGDARCPGDDSAFTTPEGSCTSSTGWEYFGYAPYVSHVEDSPSGGSRQRVEIAQISFAITSPEGDRFAAGGGFSHLQDLDTEDKAWSQIFNGTYVLTGDGASECCAPAWVQDGTQLGWEFVGARPAGAHWFTVTGPIAVGENWLYVDRIHWDESVCEGVPEVDLHVRDLDGRWYSWSSGADCSPCGAVFWDNPDGDPLELGEMCIDLSEQMTFLDTNSNFEGGG